MNVLDRASATAGNDHGEGLLQADAALFMDMRGHWLGISGDGIWTSVWELVHGKHFLYDEGYNLNELKYNKYVKVMSDLNFVIFICQNFDLFFIKLFYYRIIT